MPAAAMESCSTPNRSRHFVLPTTNSGNHGPQHVRRICSPISAGFACAADPRIPRRGQGCSFGDSNGAREANCGLTPRLETQPKIVDLALYEFRRMTCQRQTYETTTRVPHWTMQRVRPNIQYKQQPDMRKAKQTGY